MNITQKTKDNINTINDLFYEAVESEKDYLESELKQGNYTFDEYTPKWERLKYVIFQMQVSEAFEAVQTLIHMLDMTEEDINEMVKIADTDIDTALDNAVKNMVFSLFYKVLGR